MPLVYSRKIIPELSERFILVFSFIGRLAFLIFGLYQDKYMKVPYTDIDYFVFTDASRFVFNHESPYLRATYRYTPLLSWILLPSQYWFEFGKMVFVICDLLTGYLILRILSKTKRNRNLSLLWLWNPMVATISTRGSSESLLTVVVMAITYTALDSNHLLCGALTGIAVHLKIYPVIYIPAILLTIDPSQPWYQPVTWRRIKFAIASITTFSALTTLMYIIYDTEFLDEAYLYHLSRLDHRHNFSIYNLSLYFSSFKGDSSVELLAKHGIRIEKLAFVPQLLLSCVLIPLSLATTNLVSCLFIQTFTFITFNKVITSQYFIWFLCFLPIYVSTTTIGAVKGLVLVVGWSLTQALWLYYGYKLEFLGESGIFTFGIWSSSALFFAWNTYMIVQFIGDVKRQKALLTTKKDS